MAVEVLDENEELELWREFKKTKSIAIRDKLIRQYMPLVKWVAGRVSTGMPDSVEFDDLVGFGQFGLLDAIEKYDPDKNAKFKTRIGLCRARSISEISFVDGRETGFSGFPAVTRHAHLNNVSSRSSGK